MKALIPALITAFLVLEILVVAKEFPPPKIILDSHGSEQ